MGQTQQMKLLIVDDHGLFRHGLGMLLSAQLACERILHAGSAADALQAQAQHPDLDMVLLDYNLGADHGLDVLQTLKSRDPGLPVIMVSGRDDPQVILCALGSGASGFVQKNLEPAEMVAAIEMVLAGGMYVPPSLMPGGGVDFSGSAQGRQRQQQLHRLAETARRVIRDHDLDLREQAAVESEMTLALKHLLRELESDRTQLQSLAFHDELTGLANRRLFTERLEQAIKNHARHGTPLALVYLDLDHFKPVNDTHGHAVGDVLLKAIAERLTKAVRDVDTVARLGGDEFTVVLVGVESTAELARQLDRLHALLIRPVAVDERLILQPSCSLGAAVFHGAETAKQLMQRADGGLYAAKAAGRNRVKLAGAGRDRDAESHSDQ